MPGDAEMQRVRPAQTRVRLHQSPGIVEPLFRHPKNEAARSPTVKRPLRNHTLRIGQQIEPHLVRQGR